MKAYCWCIDPAQHELGLQPVTDEDFEQSLHPEPTELVPDPSGIWLNEEAWIDPRKGDLFELIQSLTPQKNAKEEDNDFYGQD